MGGCGSSVHHSPFIVFISVPSRSNPTPSATITSPGCKPLSTMYSCPPFTRVTCTGADCAFPSTTLYANTLSCTSNVAACGMTNAPAFSVGTITLPAPPLCNNPSRLGNTARRLTVPVYHSADCLDSSLLRIVRSVIQLEADFRHLFQCFFLRSVASDQS